MECGFPNFLDHKIERNFYLQDTGIAPDDQLVLSSRGAALLSHDDLLQFLEPHDPSKPLYLYSKQPPQLRVQEHLRGVSPAYPELVVAFLKGLP